MNRLLTYSYARVQVVGRAEALHQLREMAGAGKRRSSTRANKYALHVKEAYVRELPALFSTPPSVDAAGSLHVWCHPLTVGGRATAEPVIPAKAPSLAAFGSSLL